VAHYFFTVAEATLICFGYHHINSDDTSFVILYCTWIQNANLNFDACLKLKSLSVFAFKYLAEYLNANVKK
jgi:hypothetical protein